MKHRRFLDVAQATDLETFERLLIAFANDLDFGIVTASLVVDRAGAASTFVSVGNTPAGFWDASRNLEDSIRDPVLKRLKNSSVPFLYDQDFYVSEGAGDLWEQQASFGFRTGISVALRLPGQRHFLLGVDRDAPLPANEHRAMRMVADLQLLAVHAQSAAVRLLAAPLPRLTNREMAVLRWTHAGKSAWAAGRLLGITESTVNFHLGNILTKLDCSSKHQAVLKAIALGLI